MGVHEGSDIRGLLTEEVSDLIKVAERIDNPVTLGILVALLIEERRRTNKILEEIRDLLKHNAKREVEELSDADEKIVELAQERGMITAEDVKEALGYKGLNAASARLNRLYKMGVLTKIRKGRKVYYSLA